MGAGDVNRTLKVDQFREKDILELKDDSRLSCLEASTGDSRLYFSYALHFVTFFFHMTVCTF